MAQHKHPLIGDWRARIAAKLRDLGCQSMKDFLDRHPGISYENLVEILGSDISVPICISNMQFAEAKATGTMRQAAMDSLAREINHHLKDGWGIRVALDEDLEPTESDSVEFQTVCVFATWASDIEMADIRLHSITKDVWDALKRCAPPVGWKPAGPDDPIIVTAFNNAWKA